MTVSLPLWPVYIDDFLGAIIMIILALAAFTYARRLTRLDPENALWIYIFWFCTALVVLAVSRGVGHILRFILVLSGHTTAWNFLAPYSGGLNTLALAAVAILTLYYRSMQRIMARVQADARSLNKAHSALVELNQTLEQRVEHRTMELRLSEQKFRHLFEGSKDMIFFCNSQTEITDINDAGVHLLGFAKSAEVVGRSLKSFFVDREQCDRYFRILYNQGHVNEFELKFARRDNSRLYLMITTSAIHDDSGTIQGCEAIAKDLTRFKEVTDQLIQSENMASVGQLAAGVAHEINTPLGIILGYTQLLAEDFAGQPDVFDTLKTVEKQTKICKRIVADLLKFSRNTAEWVKKAADINTCLDEVLAIVEHSLNMDHIYVQRSMTSGLPRVLVDRERLRQVLVNIINNAHHAIGAEGIIGVWTSYEPKFQKVEIVIGDTGCGIPAKTIGRIFDPFFTTKGVGKGTGLGLSVSFGIIKDHNGSLEAFSPPRQQQFIEAGMRTTFHLRLPIRQEGDHDA